MKGIIKEISYDDVKKLSIYSKASEVILTNRENKPITWFGYFVEDNLIGCIGLWDLNSRAKITGWFVIRNYRGYGIGKELLDYVIDYAREKFTILEALTKHKRLLTSSGAWTELKETNETTSYYRLHLDK